MKILGIPTNSTGLPMWKDKSMLNCVGRGLALWLKGIWNTIIILQEVIFYQSWPDLLSMLKVSLLSTNAVCYCCCILGFSLTLKCWCLTTQHWSAGTKLWAWYWMTNSQNFTTVYSVEAWHAQSMPLSTLSGWGRDTDTILYLRTTDSSH